MVNAIVNTTTVKAGNRHGRNLALQVLIGQEKDPYENNRIIDRNSSLSRGMQVKYHGIPFELQTNSHNWRIKGKTSMTEDKAGGDELEEMLHRIYMLSSQTLHIGKVN